MKNMVKPNEVPILLHPKGLLLFAALLLATGSVYSRKGQTLCNSSVVTNLHKAERRICRLIRKSGKTYVDSRDSSSHSNFYQCYDSITTWLRNQACIEDSDWDKCQSRELIYPGTSIIGVRFITPEGVIEKCFRIREGTTGQIKLAGWRPKLFPSKARLKCIRIAECENFIHGQRQKCLNSD